MKLFIWIYISVTIFVSVSHTSTTLRTSTTDITDGEISVKLLSPEVTSTTMKAESPTLATTTAMSTQQPSITASGEVSVFRTSTTLPTNKTDSPENASTSVVSLGVSSTTTPSATITVLNTLNPFVTASGEVSISHTSRTLRTNTTDSTDGEISVKWLSPEVTSTTMKAELQTSATTTAMSTEHTSVTASGEVSVFHTSTTLPTNKTDISGNTSTSVVSLGVSSTTINELSPPSATTTVLNTQNPFVTVSGEVSAFYTSTTGSSNTTESPGGEISANVASLRVTTTTMKAVSSLSDRTTELSSQHSSIPSFEEDTVNATSKTVTVCSGRGFECSHFKLSCPEQEIIMITDAEYGYKTSASCLSDTTCPSDQLCCSLNVTDCFTKYSIQHVINLYTDCSGRTSCEKQAPPAVIHACSNNGSKYIHLQYNCVPGSQITNLCNASVNNTSEVHLIFPFPNGGITSNSEYTCACTISASEGIHYQLVDIRLFDASGESDVYNCTTANLTIGGKLFQCNNNDQKFVYMDSSDFKGVINVSGKYEDVIKLSFSKNLPKMVWIDLKALAGTFTLNCRQHNTEATSTKTPVISQSDITPSISSPRTEKALTEEEKSNAIPIIIAAVITVIVTIALIVAIFILYKRRCKKTAAGEDSKPDLPTEAPFTSYKSFRDSTISSAAADTSHYDSINDKYIETYSEVPDTSNYDSIHDENIVTCFKSVRKQKNRRRGSGDEKDDGGDVTADEYDIRNIQKKCPKKLSNYDSLPAAEGKARSHTYSLVTSQSKSGNDHSDNKIARKGEESHEADDYSHVDPDAGLRNEKLSNLNDEDSYNHIDYETTKTLVRDEKAICEGTSSGKCVESANTANTTSKNVASEMFAMKDDKYGLLSQDSMWQEIKVVSLKDNYIEFKQGDIYDIPKTKDEQYALVLKDKTEHRPNGLDSEIQRKIEFEEKESTNTLEHEFAKPIEF